MKTVTSPMSSQPQSVENQTESRINAPVNRRSFLKNSAVAGAGAVGAGLLATSKNVLAEENHGHLTRGDAALLRFAAAAEILETDFWVQYNELAGVQDNEFPGGGGTGNPDYTNAIAVLDSDMAQYIHDNTDDEFTHQNFLNAYLMSKGAAPVSLEKFRTLKGSTATGSTGALRLTNLMQLTVDTSWWTRYRMGDHNPDLEPNFAFPQAIPTLAVGQHTAIPRTDADLTDSNFLQAIANTAGFHFATIEQGGTSLYPAMAQRATSVEVLRILISIGPTETMHFQTWQDKAGNAVPLTDGNLTFPDLNSGVDPNTGSSGLNVADEFQTNLIMPEPTIFLNRDLGPVSIIRPTSTTEAGAVAAVVGFVNDGLFLDPSSGRNTGIVEVLMELAERADAAHRIG